MNRLARLNGKNRFQTTNELAKRYNQPTKIIIANGYAYSDLSVAQSLAGKLGVEQPLITSTTEYDWYLKCAIEEQKYYADLNGTPILPSEVLLVGGESAIPTWIEANILETLGYAPHTEHFAYIDFIDDRDDWTIKHRIPLEFWDNIQKVMDGFEIVRTAIGNLSIVIRSGYRSKKFNAEIGGKSGSQHLYGKAGDIYAIGMNCYNLAHTVYYKYRYLFNGYGLGSNTNVHFDIRSKLIQWWYRFKSWVEWKLNQ